ncbi:MAG TPA: serine hydrolase [Ruminococcus sp.]|nr:serine hydrolase [Ruminococcus sp.]
MNKRGKGKTEPRYLRIGAVVFLLILIFFGIVLSSSSCRAVTADNADEQTDARTSAAAVSDAEESEPISGEYSDHAGETAASIVVYPRKTNKTKELSKDYDAKTAVLICTDNNEIIADRNSTKKIYPASLTKVMTLVVAVENISDLSEKVTITYEMVEPMIELDASRAGFIPGETPTLEDVLYGMILMSGADASLAVADHVAGSEEAFVRLMNDKAKEMGLKDTHFTNTVGLHDEEHYSTAADMAVILEYAVRNDTCRKVLSAYEYKVAPTEQNPDGLTFESTIFSRMYGDEMPGVVVKGGKTGYTDEAGNCIESFAVIEGKTYILVLCGGTTNWNNIYNTLSAYSEYCAGGKPYEPPA